ncbi:protein kinase domain-containing protein [Streptomyces sp. 8N616]|uniref:protein kinase domain-containing protein n=1 Tax=Streptomyces sp. 8N616 TaxID=3457414 RepID=UPI003FD47461
MRGWVVPGYSESRELGSGASGRVVLAVHDATGTPVAVKYLNEKLRADARFLREFRAEARLLGDLDSLHVARLYEYVEAPQGAAIVMELVDGVALRALLRQEGATGPEAALVVLKGSLLGLAAAHGAGVVHRDYKPENVLVAADGSSKLVDFGIAARSGDSAGAAGTPTYMAPEQWSGEPASPTADVYAATATFYECVTGRKPYTGENFAELALQHINAPIPDEEAPEPVRALIRRGLAKTPEERPENAAAFVEELESVACAAYGEDWEERGQRRLAALAALLPLLFPSAGGSAAGTTELATTVLPDRARGFGRELGWRELLTGVGVLIIAGVLTFTAGATSGNREAVAETLATTSAAANTGSPGETSPTAGTSSSASPSTSAGGTPTGSSSPSASASASEGGDSAPAGGTDTGGLGSPSGPGTATDPPVSNPSTSDSAPNATTEPSATPVRVTSVSVGSLQQTGSTSATASVNVSTTGTGAVTLTVTWYASDSKGSLGEQDGVSQTFALSGRTAYTITADHVFRSPACYWGVVGTTDPEADNGSSWQQKLIRQCDIR